MTRKQDMTNKINERIDLVKNFSHKLERSYDDEIIIAVERAKRKEKFDFPKNPQQGEKLKKTIIENMFEARIAKNTFESADPIDLRTKNILDVEKALRKGDKFYSVFPCFNDEHQANEKFEGKVNMFNPAPTHNNYPLRTGVLGYKVGMMSTFDMWGYSIPLTVIQVDRC